MVPACGPMCPPPAGNRVPVRARTPTTTAASSEAVTSTGVSNRGRPRRPPALPLASAGGGAALPPAGAGHGTGPPASHHDRPAPCGRMAASTASRSLAVGRSPGRLSRQLATTVRSSAPMSSSWAGLFTSRYISAALDPEPNGPCPVAAKASTAPRLKMSLADPTSPARTCSGDRKPGFMPGTSVAFQVPNPVSLGPSGVSTTFEGLRLRCTRSTAYMSRRPSASPAASPSTVETGNGPCSRTVSASDGPETYAVASHGAAVSRSASTTGVANAGLTSRAAATSARNRGSAASSAAIARTTTGCPPGRSARKTPPSASCLSRRYGPSPGVSCALTGVTNPIPLQTAGTPI